MIRGRLGYVLDDGTIRWAQARSEELRKGRESTDLLLEKMRELELMIQYTARTMWNQPESEMMLDYAKQLSALAASMKGTRDYWMDDLDALTRAIKNYERMKRDGYDL